MTMNPVIIQEAGEVQAHETMATKNIQRKVMREVTKQLGGSDHKPIILTLNQMPIPDYKQKSASWNYKKPDWDL